MNINYFVGSVLLAFAFVFGNIIYFGYAQQGLLSYIVYLLFCLNLLVAALLPFRLEFGRWNLALNIFLVLVLSFALSNLAQVTLALMQAGIDKQRLNNEVAELQSSTDYFMSYSSYLEQQMSSYRQNNLLISSQIKELESQKKSINAKPKEVIQYNYINETTEIIEEPVIVYYEYDDDEYEYEEEDEDDD